MDIEKALEILDEAAPYEGSENGELWRNMICVYDGLENIDFLAEQRTAIGEKIIEHAEDVEENWRWVYGHDKLVEEFEDYVDNGGTDKAEKFIEKLKKLNPRDKRLEWIG